MERVDAGTDFEGAAAGPSVPDEERGAPPEGRSDEQVGAGVRDGVDRHAADVLTAPRFDPAAERANLARDAQIVARWNEGASSGTIMAEMKTSSSVIRGVLLRAKQRGEAVRGPVKRKVMPRAPVDKGPKEGETVLTISTIGCRYILGGSGEHLKMCGKPGRQSVTWLCEEHREEYVKLDARKVR
jgi:hypothetical protein